MDVYRISRGVSVALIAAAASAPGAAFASGFALLEQSAGRLGNAYSGTTVVTDDASAMFYNPASLAKLDRMQWAAVASGVKISSKFRDQGSQPALGQPLGTEGGDAGDWNAIPSAYFAMPINERLAFGFGFNVPFGLKLEYPDDWIGRFQAINSEIQTYNFNPALAWEVNDVVTIGVGLNYQRMQAELTSAVNYTAIIAGTAASPTEVPGLVAANPQLQGLAVVRGDDSTWGFNVGAIFQIAEGTRLGIAYRSSADYDVKGFARFEAPTTADPYGSVVIASVSAPGGPFATTPASVDIELPDIATVSLSHRLNESWELFADIAWTGWSSIQEIRVERPDGSEVDSTPELWDDSWRFALGATYRMNEAWKLRVGVAYDETPVSDATRTPRLPDPDRTWIAFGAQYDAGGALTFDVGYAHLFSDDVPLSPGHALPAAGGVLVGEQESSVDIVAVQVTYRW